MNESARKKLKMQSAARVLSDAKQIVGQSGVSGRSLSLGSGARICFCAYWSKRMT
jgi:hypothetical protein